MANIALIARAAAMGLTDENARKTIGWTLVAVISPIILLIAFLCALASGSATHNISAAELCFYGGTLPADTPEEYRTYIEDMRTSFGLLDGFISTVNGMTEEEKSLDDIRVKAVFYALYFGEDSPSRQDHRKFVDCFATYEERTRTVTTTDEDGVEVETEETYTVAIPIEDMEQVSAAEWLTKSAEQDYAYAQYSLAKLYSEGKGVVQSHKTALRLYEQSAVEGFPYAAWELGKLYRDGIGCRPDERQATRYFAAAFRGFKVLESQSHDDKVQYRLGWMHLHGVGTEKDESAARSWFEKSARLGNENAQYQLAKLILGNTASTAEEIHQAVEWLTKAAEAGSQYAQYTLAKLYRDGGPVEPDHVQAVIWFSEAAEQGHQSAMYALGKLHLEEGRTEAALRWFQKVAELGNQFAQYQLGKLLLSGEGVPKDVEEAVHWFTASANQGNQYAQYILGKLYLLGKDIPQDRDAAVRWFTMAAEQGNEYAQYFLDHMNDRQGPPLLTSATRLLHHMSRIFQDETPPPQPGIHFVESKLRRKIMEKRLALGHRADDHEDQPIAMR